jgi:hypothetical protein
VAARLLAPAVVIIAAPITAATTTPAITTPASAPITSPPIFSRLRIPSLELEEVLLLAFAGPGLFPGFTGKKDILLLHLARELLSSPFLVILGALIGATDFGWWSKAIPTLLKLSTVLIESLDFLFLWLGGHLLCFFIPGRSIGRSSCVGIRRVGTRGILLGEFLSDKFVIPLTAPSGVTPSLVIFLVGVSSSGSTVTIILPAPSTPTTIATTGSSTFCGFLAEVVLAAGITITECSLVTAIGAPMATSSVTARRGSARSKIASSKLLHSLL